MSELLGDVASPAPACSARRAAAQALLQRRVVGERRQAFDSAIGSSSSAVADGVDQASRSSPGLALDQPAAEGDAVGLVDDAVRDRPRCRPWNTVLRISSVCSADTPFTLCEPMKREVAHAHAPAGVLVDQRHRGEQVGVDRIRAAGVAVEMQRVDQVDDLHVARQQPLHQRHRPGFQRLRQQRVVGVGEGRLRDRPGLVPVEFVQVDQHAHQLGDGDGRDGCR